MKTKYNYSSYLYQLYGKESNKSLVREITFQITNQCNLNCDYCYEHHKNNEVMSLETGKKIIDNIINQWEIDDKNNLINKDLKGIVLSFIGGEPFLEVELIDKILDYFFMQCFLRHCDLSKGMRISIATNGQNFFDKEVQKFIEKYKLYLSLSVSIDGIKELHDLHRKYKNGEGSFDKAIKAFDELEKYGQKSTKMTFVPSSFKYIFDSLKFMMDKNVENIICNYAYEPVYTPDDGKVLYYELKKVTDYKINNNISSSIMLLDMPIGEKIDLSKNDRNYCGGTGKMIAYAPDGSAYPCVRYCPISIGKDKSEKMKIGDLNGIFVTARQKKIREYLDSITLTSQSSQECINCPVASGCGWCSAYNYEVNGTPNKRVTNICWAHKARVLASAYYFNKSYIEGQEIKPMKINLPKEDALKIISESEFNYLKELEQSAFDLFKIKGENFKYRPF